jgi:hypothetical protein
MRIVVDVCLCVCACLKDGETVKRVFGKKGGRWVVEVEVVAKKTRILCDCRYDVNNVK